MSEQAPESTDQANLEYIDRYEREKGEQRANFNLAITLLVDTIAKIGDEDAKSFIERDESSETTPDTERQKRMSDLDEEMNKFIKNAKTARSNIGVLEHFQEMARDELIGSDIPVKDPTQEQ